MHGQCNRFVIWKNSNMNIDDMRHEKRAKEC